MTKALKISQETLRHYVEYVAIVLAIVSGSALTIVAFQYSQLIELRKTAYEVVSTNPSPTIVCLNDRVIVYNNAAEDLLGYDKFEILDGPTTAIIPDQFKARHLKAINKINKLYSFGDKHVYCIVPLLMKNGKIEKRLCIISSIKKDQDTFIMIFRIIDVINGKTWMDLETKKSYKYTLTKVDE